MAVHTLDIDAFLARAESLPVLDVRSPGEYQHAHIPGAHSFPLFDDAERKVIGTTYKQVSREQAIKIGLDYFGPKMRSMIEAAEQITNRVASGKSVLVHCWRGGMRSSAIAWLLDFYGFEVWLLEGGYKAYRAWVATHWNSAGALRILAGNTGSGKTEILAALAGKDLPVLDLEGLAAHKGSAFGGLDKMPQPSQEMFENRLAAELNVLRKKHGDAGIWIEDESQRIGDVNIPHLLYKSWAGVEHVFIEIPFEERLRRIVRDYSGYTTESLVNAIIRIKKRLGPLESKTTIGHLLEGDHEACFSILLHYYDKHYYPNGRRGNISFDGAGKSPEELADLIYQHFYE